MAALLAWLVPGLGHCYQGRIGKGILFFLCVMGLFLFGAQQGSWKIIYFRWDDKEWRWPYLAQVATGTIALPALLHKPEWRQWLPEPLARFEAPPDEAVLDDLHRTLGKRIDIALVYTMVAGLLNVLVIYDALAGPALYEEEQKMLAGNHPGGSETT